MNPPRVLRMAVVGVSMIAPVACADATGPTEADPDNPAPIVLVEGEAAAALGLAVDDVLARVLLGFDDSIELNGMSATVRSLSAALASRVPEEVTTAGDAFRQSFAKYAALQEEGSLNPDLEAVRLLVEETQLLTLNLPLVTQTTR